MANHRRGRAEGDSCPVAGCYLLLHMPHVLLIGRWSVFVREHWTLPEQADLNVQAASMQGKKPNS